jgi:hypothetical protein
MTNDEIDRAPMTRMTKLPKEIEEKRDAEARKVEFPSSKPKSVRHVGQLLTARRI